MLTKLPDADRQHKRSDCVYRPDVHQYNSCIQFLLGTAKVHRGYRKSETNSTSRQISSADSKKVVQSMQFGQANGFKAISHANTKLQGKQRGCFCFAFGAAKEYSSDEPPQAVAHGDGAQTPILLGEGKEVGGSKNDCRLCRE